MQIHKIVLNIRQKLNEKNITLCIYIRKVNRKETIRHEGIVENIGTDKLSVRILQTSACSSCSARQLCRSSESKEKVIDVRGHYPILKVGDSVTLLGSVRQGLRASMLAYVIPLVFMIVVLFVGTHLGGEAVGALSALLFLVLYYGVLSLFRNKLGKQFAFKIEMINTNNK